MRTVARLTLLLGVLATAAPAAAHPDLGEQLMAAEARGDWFRTAELHRHRREWTAAEAAYARARALDPTLAEVDLGLARVRLEAGTPVRALEAAVRYTQRRPEDPEGWSAQGQALAALGRQAAASEAFAAALARSVPSRPVLPDDYLRWARAAEAAGTPTGEVLAGLDNGAKLLSGAISLEVAALELAERHAMVSEALARMTRLEESARRKETWAARRARLLAQAGRPDEARAAWEAVQRALEALPASRRSTPAVRALDAEARLGVQLGVQR